MSEAATVPSTDEAALEDPDELAAQVALLTEENRRLRQEYARAKRSRYRRTAIGLALVGLVAVGGGVLFPDSRSVLVALGATGLFGAVLTVYLTPERFVTATVGEGVYRAWAETGAALVSELGLSDSRVYVPRGGAGSVRLYVPQYDDFELPAAEALDALFVVPEAEASRGVSLDPTGAALFRAFEQVLAGPLADDRSALADQLADGLTDQFELADGVRPDVEGAAIRLSIRGTPFGAIDRFDHPVASFLAVGLATGLDEPVAIEVATLDGDRYDFVVVCEPVVDE